MSKGIIVSGFPAVGKSFLTEHAIDNYIVDSDSSNFSWIKDSDGNNTKERNPEFPKNYIKHIKKLRKEADIVLVSSHENVREALIKNGLEFIIALPHIDCKEDWIKRLVKRNSPQSFIDLISKNWEEWIIELNEFIVDNEVGYIELWENEYLFDNLKLILFYKEFNKYGRYDD